MATQKQKDPFGDLARIQQLGNGQRQDLYFRDTEAQALMKPGEVRQILSPIDRKVFAAIHGPHGNRRRNRLTVRGIERKTGLSPIAITLATYRLVGLGLLVEKEK
jgi:hypothetical protein